jgi:hypothetical protein
LRKSRQLSIFFIGIRVLDLEPLVALLGPIARPFLQEIFSILALTDIRAFPVKGVGVAHARRESSPNRRVLMTLLGGATITPFRPVRCMPVSHMPRPRADQS